MLSAQVAPSKVASNHAQTTYRRHARARSRRYRSATWRLLVLTGTSASDLLLLILALPLADYLASSGELHTPFWLSGGIGAGVAFTILTRGSAYSIAALQSCRVQIRWIAPALVAGATAQVIVLGFLQGQPACPAPFDWLLVSLALMGGLRLALSAWVRGGVRDGWLARRVAIVGRTALGYRIAAHIALQGGAADQLVGMFDNAPPVGPADLHNSVTPADTHDYAVGRLADPVALSRRERVDAIIIALPLSRFHEMDELRSHLRTLVTNVYLAPDIGGIVTNTASMVRLGGNPVINIIRRPLEDHHALCKALFDRIVAGVLLLAFLPLLLVIAALVKADSRGPVLFRQPRMGFNNVPFTVFKFRSMYHDMADLLADRQTSRNDPRVTRVGRVLRKLSLDELPQLLNVLLGDMSLVGPRPHAPNTKAEGLLLEDAVADYAERHRIKPGITGWAQVNGARGEIKTIGQVEQRLRYDMEYIRNWTLGFDIKILFLTIAREIVSSRAF